MFVKKDTYFDTIERMFSAYNILQYISKDVSWIC